MKLYEATTRKFLSNSPSIMVKLGFDKKPVGEWTKEENEYHATFIKKISMETKMVDLFKAKGMTDKEIDNVYSIFLMEHRLQLNIEEG